jgi:hypothetical protein
LNSLAFVGVRLAGSGLDSQDSVLHAPLRVHVEPPERLIVPISASGTRRITPKRSLHIESGRVQIGYGTPIPTQGLDLEQHGWLKEQVRLAICAGFDPELQGDGSRESTTCRALEARSGSRSSRPVGWTG